MPKVNSQHALYQKRKPQWERCRDAVDGEDAVKAKTRSYLPMLGGQEADEYAAYLMRASFFNAASRTVEALAGAIMRKPPSYEIPDDLEERLATIGQCQESLEQIASMVITEVLTTGRVGLLVDAASDDGTNPYITLFPAEKIINWMCEVIDGEMTLVMAVIEEEYEKEVSDDWFEHTMDIQYRVLRLVEISGGKYQYQVEIWRKTNRSDGAQTNDFKLMEELSTVPKMVGGRALDRIPFVFVTPEGVDFGCHKPPILDLVDVNLSHYRTSADLEHGRHFTALPTVWVAGFELQTKLTIGASRAWVSENSNAKAGFLEFSGAGLGHLADAKKEKAAEMAILGGRLLEDQPNGGPESGEALKIRHSGEQSVLAKIATAASAGLTQVVQWLAFWGNAASDDDSIEVELNRNFSTLGLDAQQLTAYIGAVQGGLISYRTFFEVLQRGDVIPSNRTQEEEEALIEEGPPRMSPTPEEEVALKTAKANAKAAEKAAAAPVGGKAA